MNVKFLNPFIEAAIEVIFKETGFHFQRGDLHLEKSAYISDDTTVIISLVGGVIGNVFYSMNEQSAVRLVSKMLGEPITQFNNLAQSGIAELGNVITGSASVKLSNAGFETTISPPTLLYGKGATISTLDYPRLVVPFSSDDIFFVVHLALREGNSLGQTTATLAVPERPNVQSVNR
ncbi:MAG TPA: chemotaxis protein CheX [Anaerolineaceae bacterium]|nr:chemotaxis protein CheX [Anaerolineaceae bacterium]